MRENFLAKLAPTEGEVRRGVVAVGPGVDRILKIIEETLGAAPYGRNLLKVFP